MTWTPPFIWEDLPALTSPINSAHLINYTGSLATYVDAQVALCAKFTSALTTGDLGGTIAKPIVNRINGVTVTGAPTGTGQAIISTSSSSAAWGTLPSVEGGGGAPTGPAGGSLTGTYPNPNIALKAISEANLSAEVATKLNEKGSATGVAGGSLTGTYPNPTLGPKVVAETNLAAAVVTKLNEKGSASGAAGGVLAGFYPNPTLGAGVVAEGNLAAPVVTKINEKELPTGGLALQALVKNSGANYDVKWETISNSLKSLGSVSGTVKVKLSEGTTFTATLVGDTKFELINAPSRPEQFVLIVAQDGAGGHTWSVEGVTWVGPEQPNFLTSAGIIYRVELETIEAGAKIYGEAGGQKTGSITTYEGFGLKSAGVYVAPPGSWKPYSPESPWNQPSARTATVHEKSGEYISKLLEVEGAGKPGSMELGDSTSGFEEYGHPVYFSKLSDPSYTIKQSGTDAPITDVVNLPAGAKPANGSDHHLCIIQPNGTEYDMWNVTSITAGSPGVIQCVNAGKSSIIDKGVAVNVATAANFSLLGGQIRVEEWDAAVKGPRGTGINHALFFETHECAATTTEFGHGIKKNATNSAFVYPATHGASEGAKAAKTLPAGAWIRLNYTDKEIEELELPKWEEAIVLACARYGCFLGDTSGEKLINFQVISGYTYTSLGIADPAIAFAQANGFFHNEEAPFKDWIGKWSTGGGGAKSKKVDWTRWQVLNPPGSVPVEETPGVIQANFTLYSKEQDWPYNHLTLRPDLFRWKATTATVHENSTKVAEAIEKIAQKKLVEVQVTEGAEDFGTVTVMGNPSNPVGTESFEMEGGFGEKYPAMHVPTGARKSIGSESLNILDTPTGRVVGIGEGAETRSGGKLKAPFMSGHDYNIKGTGYSPNSKENTAALSWPEVSAEDQARAAGGTALKELGGGSSALMADTHLLIRFVNLYRADTNWEDAIPHPLAATIQGRKFNAGAGMAPRGTTKYGYGTPSEPLDGRLPYIFPAHRGEVVGNDCTAVEYKEYAPPNGCWWHLNWTKEFVAGLAAPNWMKAIYWALVQYGAFFLDVGGAAGMGFRVESPVSYGYRGDTYAKSWLESHVDGKFLKTSGANFWKMDFTGAGTMTNEFFKGIRVLAPPPKPPDLPS